MDTDPRAFVDIHSHLVPGVDDGARTLADTLDGIDRMGRVGIRKIVTTPHINGSLTLDHDSLEVRLSEVADAFTGAAHVVERQFPEVVFRQGHEVMLDVPDPDLSDPRLRMAGTSFVLVEWPRLHVPPGTTPVLQRIRDQGFRPIIAHPERYVGIDLRTAAAWREVGAYLQVNHGSLVGRYGPEARTMAVRLVRRGWVDYLASDFHARPELPLFMREAWQRLEALGAEYALAHLFRTNPARMLQDEVPVEVPPLPPERGIWARMKGILNPESV